jgi:hypothetical protein
VQREAEPLDRARPLHGEQPVLVGAVGDLGAARLALLQPLEVRTRVRRVDDEQVPELGDPVGDQVVDDAAALVREQRVLRLSVADLREVVREERLEKRRHLGPLDLDLAHVRDVEDAAVGPHRPVLRDHALVLHGHLPAGERNHASAGGDVPLVERRAKEGLRHRARL